jgi:3-phenylpropionate/trans-cinnamate dioxygenase ferredoxin reductase subunit
MAESYRLTINGTGISATAGQTLLAAAQAAGLALPHDCTKGHCETCRVSLLEGRVEDAGTSVSGTVLACKARVAADAAISFDPVPKEMRSTGVISAITELAREILEVRVTVTKPVPYLPGQYVKCAVGNAPERDLCPTLSLDGLRELDELIFHIRPAHEGALAGALAVGRKVKLRGPFGEGFLRNGYASKRNGRIILVASAAGFAPIWSMAVAARLGQPDRPLLLIASARDPRNLYMRPALQWLAKHDVNEIILTASGAVPLPPTRHGRASEHLPALVASDTVHVAGEPAMCEAIRRAAVQANAACHILPFHPATGLAKTGMGEALARLFTRQAKAAS